MDGLARERVLVFGKIWIWTVLIDEGVWFAG